MHRWKAIVSLLCLVTWLPATQHCQLENFPGLAFLHCSTDAPGSTDCGGDSCDVVERGFYKAPDNCDFVVVPVFLAATAPVAATEPETFSGSLTSPTAIPDASPASWQYYSPLAVPVRGPSLPS